MKKVSRRIICAALAICMIFSLGCSAFAAEAEDAYPHYDTYTVLGDSNAAGYGLSVYEDLCAASGSVLADGQWIDTSYAAAVSKAIGAETTNWMAHSAWRTTDFLRVVGYEGFSYTSEPESAYKEYLTDRSWVSKGQLFITAFGQTSFGNGEQLKKDIHDSVEASDLISVQFGSNDIFTYMLMALIEKWGDIFSDMIDSEDVGSAIDVLKEAMANCPEGEKATLLADVVNGCETGLAMFKANFPKILDYLRSVNPDAKILVMGVMNPMEDLLNYSKEIDFDIFTITDYTCAKANLFLIDLCKQFNDTVYVSTTDADGYGLPALDWDKVINGDDMEKIFAAIKIVHPSEIGHAQIAERILTTLKAEANTPVVTASNTSTLKRVKVSWDKVPGAVSYRVYRATSENGNYLLVNATRSNDFTDLGTLPGVTYYYKVVGVMNTAGTIRTPAGMTSLTALSVFSGLTR